jgi:hypothetical protein
VGCGYYHWRYQAAATSSPRAVIVPNDNHRHIVPKTADEHIAADRFSAVATIGAYVMPDGRFPFVVGPTLQGDKLAVVRLGGHREAGEAPWE